MWTWIPYAFLALILAFLSPAVPAALRRRLVAQPRLLFVAPAGLAAVFCAELWHYGVLAGPPALLILAYTLVPTACALVQGPAEGGTSWLDFAIMLLLWLPVELNAGREWIPRQIQGLAHSTVYGIALTLALILLRAFRGLDGMKYNLPRQGRDAFHVIAAFAAAGAVLIPLGRALSFLAPFHAAVYSPAGLLVRFAAIWAGTALPEEILFRALIQNWLMQRFGATERTLLGAAILFGCAHLNNGPGPLPNWRYAILAAIAGYLYGKVFQKASSIVASATLHALVNTVRHGFF